ncbi:PAS domain-containing protein [Caproiciproducens sp. NJN-50]|uniref:sigma-54 interaction domain-containing protein n=1 Tax=Acutalibacteraceae TaxID=3082771 RepID=UPI000FFE019C|nr:MULTISPECIES: sigma 54-interacting transcriptional regulator [Acutalibacteraceae]QAT49954.1 PAS domain-containing protein [Caproiciproducens sp. NJN-50]
MTSENVMETLSQCGLGAMLIDGEDRILAINDAGFQLMRGKGELGASLREIVPVFCGKEPSKEYWNIDFGEYLLQCPTPEVTDLAPNTRMIVFRNARNDACHDMLMCIINQVSDSVILCDEQGRVFLLNDAAVQMESLLQQEVSGRHLHDLYKVLNENDLEIPRVMEERRPRLNIRQRYVTWHGKEVDVVDDSYPIIMSGKVLGGFSVMKDWTQVDELHRQVIELQGKLLGQNAAGGNNKKSFLSAKYQFKDIIYSSAVMFDVVKKSKMSAKSDSSVMIYGETGTGKELFAQSIHNASRRANDPFLAINCAAIPENLLESLLFGTEKGAYTGAERRAGLLEQANGGTLLLDEINSMPLPLQPKLLRVIQDGLIWRVGGVSAIHVDVRIISNINIPPWQAVKEKKLRPDLLYRLGVINLTVPPLRERAEDIPLFAKHFILEFNKILLKNIKGINSDVMEVFRAYSWPGNVRELQHAIEYAMNILPDDALEITRDVIPDHILNGIPELGFSESNEERAINPSSYQTIHDMERDMLVKKLKENNRNISKTARALGISRQDLQYRIKRNNIDINEMK